MPEARHYVARIPSRGDGPLLVAQQLFAVGNSVVMIAKFLGHRSVHTTNTYYLRMDYDELIRRMNLPWEV